MTDEANPCPEPYWVARMRADGWSVRVGTDPTPLPIEPEVWFSPPTETRRGRRRRLAKIVGRLLNRHRPFKRRFASPELDAPLS